MIGYANIFTCSDAKITLHNTDYMQFFKDYIKRRGLTLHLSTLINSTCFPPNDETEVNLAIPISSRTSDNFAPPQVAGQSN